MDGNKEKELEKIVNLLKIHELDFHTKDDFLIDIGQILTPDQGYSYYWKPGQNGDDHYKTNKSQMDACLKQEGRTTYTEDETMHLHSLKNQELIFNMNSSLPWRQSEHINFKKMTTYDDATSFGIYLEFNNGFNGLKYVLGRKPMEVGIIPNVAFYVRDSSFQGNEKHPFELMIFKHLEK